MGSALTTHASWWPLKGACKARDRASASATASRFVPAFPHGVTLVRLRIARFRAERMVDSYTPEGVVHGTEEAEPLVGPWEFSFAI